MADGLLLLRAPLAAAAFALAGLAVAPAQAQFMTGTYPVIIVPPPAQSIVMPKKPKPLPAQPVARAPADASTPPPITCRYQGQARVCE